MPMTEALSDTGELAAVIDGLRDIVEGTALFPALTEQQESLRKKLSALSVQHENLSSPLVILFLGGTGVGKSTIINAIAGKLIAETGDNAVEVTDERELAAAVRHMLSRVLRKLSDRERTVIISRFGIGTNDQPKTLEEVGHIFGLTRERIRQIEARALKKLRQMLAGEAAELGLT